MTISPPLQVTPHPLHRNKPHSKDELANSRKLLLAILANSLLNKHASSFHTMVMELKETRKQHRLTQKEAASLVGIPYRTYIRYEENPAYQNSYKYKKIVEDLNAKFFIDEEHGLLELSFIKNTVQACLENHNVSRCYLFGSYARKQAKETSDIDLLIDTDVTGMAFFRMVEDLRNALHKRVDALRLADLQNGNPIILTILREGIRIL